MAFSLKRNFLAYTEGDSTQEILPPKQQPVALIFWEWCQSRASVYSLDYHPVVQQECVLVMPEKRPCLLVQCGIGLRSSMVSTKNWHIMRVSGKRTSVFSCWLFGVFCLFFLKLWNMKSICTRETWRRQMPLEKFIFIYKEKKVTQGCDGLTQETVWSLLLEGR